jgi:hypothetical protein
VVSVRPSSTLPRDAASSMTGLDFTTSHDRTRRIGVYDIPRRPVAKSVTYMSMT